MVQRLVYDEDDVRVGKKWELEKSRVSFNRECWDDSDEVKKVSVIVKLWSDMFRNDTIRPTLVLCPERVPSPIECTCDMTVPSLCINCPRPSAEEDRDKEREVPDTL